MKTKYMLTLNNKPGRFDTWKEQGKPVGQIFYAGQKSFKIKLYDSLSEVKKLIRKSIEYRMSPNLDVEEYSYLLVEVE